eukprot:TRINITY_DN5918_c0_g1_i1.p1 TRINITY_DN5918_c0_g1~~TRINITY_DN5918_c0_g1_i1.p1  ORF type:complete len:478 (+),score=85.97 TRINITY_DN5918_c0_g1_i1:26-1435(+)
MSKLTLLCSATRIKNSDPNTHRSNSDMDSGLSDPYFFISHNHNILVQSESIPNDLYPHWNPVEIDLCCLNSEDMLEFVVVDEDHSSRDDYLGHFKISVGQLLQIENLKIHLQKSDEVCDDRGVFELTVVDEVSLEEEFFRGLSNGLFLAFPTVAKENPEHILEYMETVKNSLRHEGFVGDKFEDYVERIVHWFTGDDEKDVIPYPTFKMNAWHDRHNPFVSQFLGEVLAIRIPLGKSHTDTVKTCVGKIESCDHFLFSVDAVNEKYAEESGITAEKVDLVSALRYHTFRFAPLSLYLVYEKEEDESPYYYILESGTAFGEKAVLYYCSGSGSCDHLTGYEPTPFSSPKNNYHCEVSITGQNPETVSIASTQPGETSPYITVTISYELLSDPTCEQNIIPCNNIYNAFIRAMAIMDGFDWIARFPRFLQKLIIHFAEQGRKLPWGTQPPVHLAPEPSIFSAVAGFFKGTN